MKTWTYVGLGLLVLVTLFAGVQVCRLPPKAPPPKESESFQGLGRRTLDHQGQSEHLLPQDAPRQDVP